MAVNEQGSVVDKNFASILAKSFEFGHHHTIVSSAKRISMLHLETLSILWQLAHLTSGTVLEIGPYIGGSSVVLADALKPSGRKLLSIEKGGVYSTHDALPSFDIISDLRKNLSKYEVADVVDLIVGDIKDIRVQNELDQKVADESVSLLFIDADGHVERDFPTVEKYLQDGAFVVFDDYESLDWNESADWSSFKQALVRPYVEKGLKEGYFETLGIFPWGTWVGRFHRLKFRCVI